MLIIDCWHAELLWSKTSLTIHKSLEWHVHGKTRPACAATQLLECILGVHKKDSCAPHKVIGFTFSVQDSTSSNAFIILSMLASRVSVLHLYYEMGIMNDLYSLYLIINQMMLFCLTLSSLPLLCCIVILIGCHSSVESVWSCSPPHGCKSMLCCCRLC